MALTPNFSSAQSLSNLSQVTFTDTSTGTDGTITSRQIYIQLANGNYLTSAGESTTSAFETWSYSNSTITLSLLSKSTAATVTVKWLSGTTVTYTKVIVSEWDLYDYLFAFELLQTQTANPAVIEDAEYYSNFFMFLTNLWNSENSVTVGSDVYSSQAALDKNYYLMNNQSKFF